MATEETKFVVLDAQIAAARFEVARVREASELDRQGFPVDTEFDRERTSRIELLQRRIAHIEQEKDRLIDELEREYENSAPS